MRWIIGLRFWNSSRSNSIPVGTSRPVRGQRIMTTPILNSYATPMGLQEEAYDDGAEEKSPAG
jgi:hypothetical protein